MGCWKWFLLWSSLRNFRYKKLLYLRRVTYASHRNICTVWIPNVQNKHVITVQPFLFTALHSRWRDPYWGTILCYTWFNAEECGSVVMSVRCTGRVVGLLRASSAVRALLSEVRVQLNEVLCFIWRRSKHLRLLNVVVRMIRGQGWTGKRSGRKLSSRNRDSIPGFVYSDSGKLQQAGCVSRGTFSECSFRAMYSIYCTNQYSIRINTMRTGDADLRF